MKNKSKGILGISITLLILVIVLVLISLTRKIASNPTGTIGNSAGNLYNGGLFTEQDGIVYFSNPYDSNSLYQMKSNETKLKKLSNSQAKYLNIGGNYLYYYQEDSSDSSSYGFIKNISGLYRLNTKNQRAKCFTRNQAGMLLLVDNTLYFPFKEDGKEEMLYQITTDQKDFIGIYEDPVNPVNVTSDTLYFGGKKYDHNLYSMDLTTKTVESVLDKNIWNPIVQDGYVYYMDVDANYCLSRYHLSSGETETLTTDRVDLFNMNDTYIYYQKNEKDNYALMRMNLDGSDPTVISKGIYSNISITSQYIYFTAFGSTVPVYKTPTDSSVQISTFDAAKDILKK